MMSFSVDVRLLVRIQRYVYITPNISVCSLPCLSFKGLRCTTSLYDFPSIKLFMLTERVFLMESHIGVSVTILTSDYDSPNGSPTREIAKILLVRILCIELVGWNKLVVKV